ncbi:hypothetical protein [Arsenophonus nasoniae]|uniref:hypothetical protein n=1 Tax=Arsenophonus nasoniae TaxID=638 RepID=UPI0030844953
MACGIKDVASTQKETFATTQAVWRFLNNEKISFSKLNQPILELANREIKQSTHTYALMIHDWSHLKFVTHKSKKRILKMSHHGDLGYELQSSLLVDAAKDYQLYRFLNP